MGLLGWVAFVYIGLRVRRIRWILWGTGYFGIFMFFAILPSGSKLAEASVGLMMVAGFFSIVHAFLVRDDYLVSLENRMHEAAQEEARARSRLEAEHRSRGGESPSSQGSEELEYAESSDTDSGARQANIAESATESPQTAAPALAQVETSVGSGSEANGSSQIRSISDTYPLPIAYGWSLLAGLWDPRDRYREQLRHAENMLAFLGSVSLALLEKQDHKKKDLKGLWRIGSTFGGWRWIIQRNAEVLREYKDNPLALAIHGLKIDSPEKSDFAADVAALIAARNDYSHGRGPVIEEDIVRASNEAQERLQRCMEAMHFLVQYPIRLIQDFDIDRRNNEFVLKCLRLTGDGPGFFQEKVVAPVILPRGDIFLDLGNQNWVPLYPFIIASNCPRCLYRETYFVDRWNDKEGTALMKSFERGHTEERIDVSEFLTALASEQKDATT